VPELDLVAELDVVRADPRALDRQAVAVEDLAADEVLELGRGL
jgi:hypothetical protein